MGCPTTVELGDSLTFSICTHDAETGILTDASAAPPYRVYENETAGAITNGTMSVLDTGNTTGFYTESILCDVAGGYENGKTYTIYIEATVNGNTGGISYGFTVVNTNTSVAMIENIVRNRIDVRNLDGRVILYDDAGVPIFTVADCVTDDSTTTTRKRLE